MLSVFSFSRFIAGLRCLPLVAFVLGFTFYAPEAVAQRTVRIAAVVNDDIISVYDLNARVSLLIASSGQRDTQEARRRFTPQVLRNLIGEKIKMQEAKRLKISVSEGELKKALKQLEKKNVFPRGGGLDGFLAMNNIKKSVLMEQIEAEIVWIKLVARKARYFSTISEEQIDEVMARIEVNKGKPELRVSEIFLPINQPGDEADVATTATRLIEQIKSGVSFRALARNYSKSASAAIGGELGWIKTGNLGAERDRALAGMKPGDISQPIRTLTGYYIIKLWDRRADPGLSTGTARVSLRQLFIPIPPKADPTVLSKLRSKAADLSARASNCTDMDKLEKETGSALSGKLGRLKISALPSNFRTVVQGLKVFQASPPIRTKDSFIVLMVCEKKEDRKIDPRIKIKNNLKSQQRSIISRRYFRDLKRSAFIDIRL